MRIRKRKAEAEVQVEPDEAEDVFYETGAWAFYRSKELVKVGHLEDGGLILQRRDGSYEEIEEAELLVDFEPVKGILKSFW